MCLRGLRRLQQIYDHAQLSVRLFPVTAPDATNEAPAAATLPTTIYGPTCDGMDTLLRGVALPEMDIGEWLQWPSMGAYTLAAGSAFNGFDSQAVPVHYVFSGALA